MVGIPIKVLVGSFINITSFDVVDSFGQKTKIRSVSNSRYLASWNNGSFFSLDKINKQSYEAPDNSLFYPPVIAKALNGKRIIKPFLEEAGLKK